MADYSINAVPRKVSYTGSAGLGPYAFTFEVLTEDDVAVYFNKTLLTKTTDYTVTVNANGTGEVTLIIGSGVPATPDADDLVIIVGARDIERTTDFVTAGDLRATALNEQLDALTIMVQQVAEEVERSVKAPVFDPTGINMILPKQSERVNAFVAFDANGDISAAVPSDDVTTLAEVATDIKTLADIEDGTDATDAIQTAASISTDISTVSGISSDVTIVAADQTDIGTVATDLASADNIGTVAGSIANVNATGSDIANVNTVAGELGVGQDVTVVAADLSGTDTIGTVAGSIADVNTVASVSADVTTVAGIDTNVTTVAGISADVTTVANNDTNVTTVATNIANVNTVATDIADVSTVAADLNEAVSDIETVAGSIANVDIVGSNIASVNTVAGISGDVSIVAGDSADIQLLADNIGDINAKVNKTGDTMTGDLIFDTTGALTLPDGTEAQRPTPLAGMVRLNTETSQFEGYNGTVWGSLGGGATGGGGDQVFVENDQVVTANYTIPADKNASSTGPIEIDDGVTVTISDGARWVVL